MSLILHAIVFHKPSYKSKAECLKKARSMFPHEIIKGFVRITNESFRVRVVPKTQFDKTSYISKKLTPDITIVLGKRK